MEKKPTLHETLVLMEYHGLHPNYMTIQCANCEKEMNGGQQEGLVAIEYYEEACQQNGWDADNQLCPECADYRDEEMAKQNALEQAVDRYQSRMEDKLEDALERGKYIH